MTPRRMFSFATMMVAAQRRHAEKAWPAPSSERLADAPALVLVKSDDEARRKPPTPAPTPWLQLA